MKLDRNINPEGLGKYALIKWRSLPNPVPEKIVDALAVLDEAGMLDRGDTPDTDFFVIRLKDKYAAHALDAYGGAAAKDDEEYGREVLHLAVLSFQHPNRRKPD